jgi:hypothetical protein
MVYVMTDFEEATRIAKESSEQLKLLTYWLERQDIDHFASAAALGLILLGQAECHCHQMSDPNACLREIKAAELHDKYIKKIIQGSKKIL